jgi:arginyl-tRNA synthetase
MRRIIANILSPLNLPLTQIIDLLETPQAKEHGDITFPCFSLAKSMRKSPQLIALEIKNQLENPLHPAIHKIEVIGAYVNFFLNRENYALKLITQTEAEQLANIQNSENQTVLIEYSSPNIAKDFKLYHIRSTIIGQALANTYEVLGYNVVKINHLGDWGSQFGKLIAAIKRWGNQAIIQKNPLKELTDLYVKFHKEIDEKKEVLDLQAKSWFQKLEQGDAEAIRLWEWIKDESLLEFNKLYQKLSVSFDVMVGESYFSEYMPDVIHQLTLANLLSDSEDAKVVDLSDVGLIPCLIQKSDGTSIYATRDIAAAMDREKRYAPDKMLYVVDQRQALHFQQVFAVLQKMNIPIGSIAEHVSFGVMRLNGEIGKTREGKGLLLHDVLDEAIEKAKTIIDLKNPDLPNKEQVAEAIGIGAIVFHDLKQHRSNDIDFNIDEALSFEGKTGPYVQYTHARIQSVLRKGGMQEPLSETHLFFSNDTAWDVIREISYYPEVLLQTANKNDPSQIARYLLSICQSFNRLYAHEKLIVEDAHEKQAKLAICYKLGSILSHGLALLTMKAPNEL